MKPTVIDLFCGAGGFSEGFRQQGFKIIQGIDHWEQAIKTFNHNFQLNCKRNDILFFKTSVEAIEALPDSDVIIGSPPCVSFSSSNNSGKADKSSGITLTMIFLKIVAVKKWKKNSKLKAWFMENVPSSINYLASEYTFKELGLGDWATKNNIELSKVAISLKENQYIINSADYGSPQSRERVIAGEIINKQRLVIPEKTHTIDTVSQPDLKPWVSIRDSIRRLPSPICKKSYRKIVDPNYKRICINLNLITDHFYDTGLFECEWKQSRFLKINHPYMGRMAFPENDGKPSRTITATKIGTSREALIYKSEYNRKGDGEFRTPTVREAACIMGFPITYQFIGNETTKWRLVGNAVCPSVSRAFARVVRKELGLRTINFPLVNLIPRINGVGNLNSFSNKLFNNPPKRNKGSRFRRHPFKDGNLTVTLSNYNIDKNEKKISKWVTSVQYGNGKGFPIYCFPNGYYKIIEPIIENLKSGKEFLYIINNGFTAKIGTAKELQKMYEYQKSDNTQLEPTELVEEVGRIIDTLSIGQMIFKQGDKKVFKNKDSIPVKQLLALYAINKISSTANGN